MINGPSAEFSLGLSANGVWIVPGVLATSILFSPCLLANPVGPEVISGQVSINHPATNILQITNSPGAIVNWQGFSVEKNEITKFIQQNQQSAILNRVVGGLPSEILGQIESNGRVFLINPNGVLFGRQSSINTASLIASTLGIDDNDFISGHLAFKNRSGAASISNQGTLLAQNHIVLIAPDIKNTGSITVIDGEVILAAGESVLLADLQNPQVTFEVEAAPSKIQNLGVITAHSGSIDMFADSLSHSGGLSVNSVALGASGSIKLIANDAISVTADAVISADGVDGGSIRIQSLSGTNLIKGSVHAKGIAGQGGKVSILGNTVAVVGDAEINVDGASNGGTVWLGGQWQGGSVQQAERVALGKSAVINASAVGNGDGGTVAVWSTEQTHSLGIINARGAGLGNNGGAVETSSLGTLSLGAVAPDVSSVLGSAGNWLLDPTNISIVAASAIVDVSAEIPVDNSGVDDLFSSTPGLSLVNVDLITSALESGTDVTIKTTTDDGNQAGDIFVSTAINFVAGTTTSGVSLTLEAAGEISIDNNITNTGSNAFSLVLTAGTASDPDDVIVNANLLPGINGAVDVNGYLVVDFGNEVTIAGDVTVTDGSLELFGTLNISDSITQSNSAVGARNIISDSGILKLNNNLGDSSLDEVDLAGGLISITGSTASSANLTIADLRQVFFGTLSGGTVEITDTMLWFSGTQSNGTTIINGGASGEISSFSPKNLNQRQIKLQNSAQLTFNRALIDIVEGASAAVVVDPSATLSFTSFNSLSSAVGFQITNNGDVTLNSQGGLINIEGALNNLTGATATAAANSDVDFQSLSVAGGTLTLNSNSSIFTPTVTVSNSASSIFINSTAELEVQSEMGTAPATFNLSGGAIQNSGEIFIQGNFNWSGGELAGSGLTEVFDVSVSGGLNLSGSSTKTLNAQQLFLISGSSQLAGSGDLILNNNANITIGDGSEFTNAQLQITGSLNITTDTTSAPGSINVSPFATYSVAIASGQSHNIDVVLDNDGFFEISGSNTTVNIGGRDGEHFGRFDATNSNTIAFVNTPSIGPGDQSFGGASVIGGSGTIDISDIGSLTVLDDGLFGGLRIESGTGLNVFAFNSVAISGNGVLTLAPLDQGSSPALATRYSFSGINSFNNGTVFVQNDATLTVRGVDTGDTALTVNLLVNNGNLILDSSLMPAAVQNINLSVTGGDGLQNNAGLQILDSGGLGGDRIVNSLLDNTDTGVIFVTTEANLNAVAGEHVNRGLITITGGGNAASLAVAFSGTGDKVFNLERGDITTAFTGDTFTAVGVDLLRAGVDDTTPLNSVSGTSAVAAFAGADFGGTAAIINTRGTPTILDAADVTADASAGGLVLLQGEFEIVGNVTVADFLSIEGNASLSLFSASSTASVFTVNAGAVVNVGLGELNLFEENPGTAMFNGTLRVSTGSEINLKNGSYTFQGATLTGGGTINLVGDVGNPLTVSFGTVSSTTSIDPTLQSFGSGGATPTILRVSDVDLTGAGSISNKGLIEIAGASTISPEISNFGLIRVDANRGIDPITLEFTSLATNVLFQGGVTNAGAIQLFGNSGATADIIVFDNGSGSDSLTNTGFLQANTGAISIDNGASFSNSNIILSDSSLDIVGDVALSGINNFFGLGNIDFDNSNSAAIDFSGTTQFGEFDFGTGLQVGFSNTNFSGGGTINNNATFVVNDSADFSGTNIHSHGLIRVNNTANPTTVVFDTIDNEGGFSTVAADAGLLNVNVIGQFNSDDFDSGFDAVTLNAGTLTLSGGGFISGQFNIVDSAGVELVFTDSIVTLQDGLIFVGGGDVTVLDSSVTIAGDGEQIFLSNINFQLQNGTIAGSGVVSNFSDFSVTGVSSIEMDVNNFGNFVVDTDLSGTSVATDVNLDGRFLNLGTVSLTGNASLQTDFNDDFVSVPVSDTGGGIGSSSAISTLQINTGVVNFSGADNFFASFDFEVAQGAELNFVGGNYTFFGNTGFAVPSGGGNGGSVSFGASSIEIVDNNRLAGTRVGQGFTLDLAGVNFIGDGVLVNEGVIVVTGATDLDEIILANTAQLSSFAGLVKIDASTGDTSLTLDSFENDALATVELIGNNNASIIVLDSNNGDPVQQTGGFTNNGQISVSGSTGNKIIRGDFASGINSSISVSGVTFDLDILKNDSEIAGVVDLDTATSALVISQNSDSIFTFLDVDFSLVPGASLTVSGGELGFFSTTTGATFSGSGSFNLDSVSVIGQGATLDFDQLLVNISGSSSVQDISFDVDAAVSVTAELLFINDFDLDNTGSASLGIDGNVVAVGQNNFTIDTAINSSGSLTLAGTNNSGVTTLFTVSTLNNNGVIQSSASTTAGNRLLIGNVNNLSSGSIILDDADLTIVDADGLDNSGLISLFSVLGGGPATAGGDLTITSTSATALNLLAGTVSIANNELDLEGSDLSWSAGNINGSGLITADVQFGAGVKIFDGPTWEISTITLLDNGSNSNSLSLLSGDLTVDNGIVNLGVNTTLTINDNALRELNGTKTLTVDGTLNLNDSDLLFDSVNVMGAVNLTRSALMSDGNSEFSGQVNLAGASGQTSALSFAAGAIHTLNTGASFSGGLFTELELAGTFLINASNGASLDVVDFDVPTIALDTAVISSGTGVGVFPGELRISNANLVNRSAGNLTVDTTGSLSFDGVTSIGLNALTVNGSLVLTNQDSDIAVSNFVLAAGASLTANNNVSTLSTGSTINASGLLNISGLLSIGTETDSTLSLNGGLTNVFAVNSFAGNGELALQNSNFNLTNSFTVSNSQVFSIVSASLSSSANFTLLGGTNPGQFNIDSASNVNLNSTANILGDVLVDGESTLNLNGSSVVSAAVSVFGSSSVNVFGDSTLSGTFTLDQAELRLTNAGNHSLGANLNIAALDSNDGPAANVFLTGGLFSIDQGSVDFAGNTLSIGNRANLEVIAGALTNATIEVASGGSADIGNSTNIAGTVVVNDGGSLMLGDAVSNNTLNISNLINRGALTLNGLIGGDTTLNGSINNSGSITLTQQDLSIVATGQQQIGGFVSVIAADFEVQGDVIDLNSANFSISNSQINLFASSVNTNASNAQGSGTLTLNTANSLGVSGINSWQTVNFVASDLTISGAGSLILGDSSLSGDSALTNNAELQINNGTLSNVNDFLVSGDLSLQNGVVEASSITLQNGGQLTGNGSLSSNLTNLSGILSPGNSPGSLSLLGNYTQGSDGVLVLELGGDAASSSDSFSITGDASFDGRLQLVALNGYTEANAAGLQPLEISGAVSGDFATVAITDQRVDSNAVQLDLAFDVTQAPDFVSATFTEVVQAPNPDLGEGGIPPATGEPSTTPEQRLSGIVDEDQQPGAEKRLSQNDDQINRDSAGAGSTSNCLKNNQDSPREQPKEQSKNEQDGKNSKDKKSAQKQDAKQGPKGGHGAGCGTA